MLGPVDLTESNPRTYTSSSLAKFAWDTDPAEEDETLGLLFVEFADGGQYVYMGAARRHFYKMKELSSGDHSQTTGEYFHANIVDRYDRRGEDYSKFEDILEE